jgi:anti-anti-sigma factor
VVLTEITDSTPNRYSDPANFSATPGVIQGEKAGASGSGRREVLMLIDVTEPGRLVALTGRLDVSSVADVRLALHAAVDDGSGDLFVDASAVDSIDASGLGVLVGAHRRAGRAGRRLVVAAASTPVLRMLHLTKLDRVLCLTPSAPLRTSVSFAEAG